MAEPKTDKLTVSLRRDDAAGLAQFGVDVGGAFVPFAQIKTGKLDVLIQKAEDAAAAAKTSRSK